MRLALRLVILGVLAFQAWHAAVLTRYERRFHDGERAYDRWDGEAALAAFEAAREVDDSDADVWRRNGDMALYIHDFPNQAKGEHDPEVLLEQAGRGYAGAVLRCPPDSWSWSGVAAVALHRAELRELREGVDLAVLERRSRGVLDPDRAMALAAARLAVRLKPAGFQELDVLASVYDSIGKLDEAKRTYVESARMMPVASFHVWGTGRRLARPMYQAILQGLKEGIELAPGYENSMLNVEIAVFAKAHGDYETAIEHAKLARTGARSSYEVYRSMWELAGALERVGRFAEALDALKVARENVADRAAMSHRVGNLQLRVGKVEEACVSLREALRMEPEHRGLRMRAAEACEKAGELELAERVLREGFVEPTDDLTLARALLEFHRRQGRVNVSTYLLGTWARDYPDQEEFRLWRDREPSQSP